MPGACFRDERDECDLYEDKRARHDAILAEAYRNGRAAGLQGLGTAGRPEDTEEDREWQRGYRDGLAEFQRRAA